MRCALCAGALVSAWRPGGGDALNAVARHSRGVAGCTVTVLAGWVTGGPSDPGPRCRGASGQISMSTRGERRVRSRIMRRCGRAVARIQCCHVCGRSCDSCVARRRDLRCTRRTSDVVACRDERRSSVAFDQNSPHKIKHTARSIRTAALSVVERCRVAVTAAWRGLHFSARAGPRKDHEHAPQTTGPHGGPLAFRIACSHDSGGQPECVARKRESSNKESLSEGSSRIQAFQF